MSALNTSTEIRTEPKRGSSPLLAAGPHDRASRRSRLRRGGAWIFAGRSLGMATLFLIVVFLARTLSTDDFASYVVTASVVTLLGVVGTMGLNQLVCRRIAYFLAWGDVSAAGRTTRHLTALGFVATWVTAGAYLCIAPTLASWLACPALSQYAPLIALWVMLLAWSQIIAEAYRGIHDLRAAGMLAGISGGFLANFQFLVAILVLNLWGVLNYSSTLVAAIASFLIPTLGGAVGLISRWPRFAAARDDQDGAPSNPPDDVVREANSFDVLREGIPIMLVNLIALGFDQAGQLIATASGQPADVAMFEAVWRIAMIGIVPLTMLGLAVASTMAELHALRRREELERLVRGVSTLSALVTIPALGVLIVGASPILVGIFGPAYSSGVSALILLALVQIVRNWAGPCDTLLIMTGHQRAAFMSFLVASPILCLGPWAVSQWGVTGIAAVIAAAVLASRLLQYAAVRIYLGLRPHADFRPVFLRSVWRFVATKSSRVKPSLR